MPRPYRDSKNQGRNNFVIVVRPTVRGIVEADPYIFVGADSISARGAVPAAALHGRIGNAPLRVFCA